MTNKKPSLLIDSSHSGLQDKHLGPLSLDARQPARSLSKERIQTWYNGILGNVTVQTKSSLIGSALNVRIFDETSEETVYILRPSFLKKYYELRYLKSCGRISRTLNIDRVVD